MELTVVARRSLLGRCAVTLFAMLMVLSCTRQTSGEPLPPQVPTPWSGPLDGVTVVWSAGPGIDLVTGPAVAVRAYLESEELAEAMGTSRAAYPGFIRAVLDTQRPGNPWPYTKQTRRYPLVGSKRWHVLRIDTNQRSVAAVIGSYSGFTSANDLGNGKFGYPPHALDFDGVDALRISMTAPTTPSDLPPQRGPASAPVDDVFGGWRIDDRQVGGRREPRDWSTVEEDLQLCRDRAPAPLERRQFLLHGEHARSDYPTLPAYPGWPAAPPS
jgi:hypothetical protein